MITEKYHISGMHCASCKVNIENTLKKNDHIGEVTVNYGAETLTVAYDDQNLDENDIKKIVQSAGDYSIKDAKKGHAKEKKRSQQREIKSMKRNVMIVGIAAIPFIFDMIMMITNVFGIGGHGILMESALGQIHIAGVSFLNWIYVVLSGFILFYGGHTFFRNAYRVAKNFSTNMDTLVVLGASSAWLYSTAVVFFVEKKAHIAYPVFFEASVFIIFFILIGRYLEKRSRVATQKSVESLYAIQSKTAIVVKNGKEIEIPIEKVKIGDRVIVRAGRQIPVDGVIVDGATSIDESMISGESMPVQKGPSDSVIGGTLNKTGYIICEAQKIGSETVLSQIIKMVEEAQGTSVPIQKLADKVSSIFVPIIIVIAVLTFVFWFFFGSHIGVVQQQDVLSFAIYVTISVLVIACPCALGLATPTAIVVSIGHAAKRGILIKSAQIIENAHKIKYIIFDKTGTITQGTPSVIDVLYFDDERICSSYAYAVESLSDHPVAHAITEFTKEKATAYADPSDFHNLEGVGAQAKVNDKNVLVVKTAEIQKYITLSEEQKMDIATFEKRGYTTSGLVVDKKIMAIYAVADPVKKTSARAIEKIKKDGIESIMVTGDNDLIAQTVAAEVGIDHVVSNAVPADKERIVREIKKSTQDKKTLVAVVGDGINDAPALARADIGIAMGSGSDIAIESGDIVIVKGSLQKVVESIALSHKTMRIIKQNLFWAFGYNVLAIPIASGLLYPYFGIVLSPAIAAAAMALSSVSVVANSLRLRNF
jgi:P-type Cu+ transporter